LADPWYCGALACTWPRGTMGGGGKAANERQPGEAVPFYPRNRWAFRKRWPWLNGAAHCGEGQCCWVCRLSTGAGLPRAGGGASAAGGAWLCSNCSCPRISAARLTAPPLPKTPGDTVRDDPSRGFVCSAGTAQHKPCPPCTPVLRSSYGRCQAWHSSTEAGGSTVAVAAPRPWQRKRPPTRSRRRSLDVAVPAGHRRQAAGRRGSGHRSLGQTAATNGNGSEIEERPAQRGASRGLTACFPAAPLWAVPNSRAAAQTPITPGVKRV
jgi:hypothetical protein